MTDLEKFIEDAERFVSEVCPGAGDEVQKIAVEKISANFRFLFDELGNALVTRPAK
jgi:hypothetical protein